MTLCLFTDKLFSQTIGKTKTEEFKADFEKIPPEYHHLFIQMMQVRYGSMINLWDNTQPFTKPEPKKKKWYQIWK